MDRSKVLELAHEAELARQFALEVPFVVDRLQRFAALIEREVRGDAEPVAWLHTPNELHKKTCLPSLSFSRNRDLSLYGASVPLYINPPLTVVAQLVEALRRVMDLDCPITGNPSHAELVEHWEYEKTQGRGEADDRLFALAALATAKKAGL